MKARTIITLALVASLAVHATADGTKPVKRQRTRSNAMYSVAFKDGEIRKLFGNPFSDEAVTPIPSPSDAAPTPNIEAQPAGPAAPVPQPVVPESILAEPSFTVPAEPATLSPVYSDGGVVPLPAAEEQPLYDATPAPVLQETIVAPSTSAAPGFAPSFPPVSTGFACDTAGGCDAGGCTSASCGSYNTGCCPSGGCLGGCNIGDPWTLSEYVHGDCPPCVTIGGWFSAGYHTADNGLFNSRPDKLGLHQGWLFAEKVADAESPIGFRADIMYGLDADDTQAFGNPPGSWDFDNGLDHGAYGWAIPQLYGEVALGDTWSVKAGHFYTLIGYEVVTAPDNFFYSHAITMYNSEPFTHTGVLATGAVTDNLTIYAGWTLGWDTGFDQLNDGSSWLGGIGVTLSEDASFTYISTAGNFGARGDEAYSHSVLLDVTLTDSLNYVFQSDMVRVNGTGEDNIGINQYLLYSVSDCFGLGGRFEWWKGDVLTGYAPHGATLPAFGSLSYYAMTFGANVRPHANVVIRPEVRIDWSPAADYDETYFGIDAVFTF